MLLVLFQSVCDILRLNNQLLLQEHWRTQPWRRRKHRNDLTEISSILSRTLKSSRTSSAFSNPRVTFSPAIHSKLVAPTANYGVLRFGVANESRRPCGLCSGRCCKPMYTHPQWPKWCKSTHQRAFTVSESGKSRRVWGRFMEADGIIQG